MKVFSSPEGLAIILAILAVLIYRFFAVVRRGAFLDSVGAYQAGFMWGAWFCAILSLTVYHPIVRDAFVTRVGPNFADVPRMLFTVVGFIMATQLWYELAPPLKPRWNWPTYMGGLMVASYVLVILSTSLGQTIFPHPPSFYRHVVAESLLDIFLLLVIIRIGFPSVRWSWRQEKQIAMRLRILLMPLFLFSFSMLLANDLAYDLLMGINQEWPFFNTIFLIGVVAFCITFIIVFCVPKVGFVYLIRASNYLSDLLALVFIRVVELQMARWIGRRPISLGMTEVIFMPSVAVYRSVIAIFDGRKSLKAHAAIQPQKLGRKLDPIACPELEYPEIIMQLRHLGQEFIMGRGVKNDA